ncbi:neurofilament heavy polypeptide-like isoform X3 [Varroa destructor]|nr:neurofilament heavy polypeptide-like isoform X3 [Varroa destructor]XP_022644006.1 neurofilament heavy polypeptide-like isoform X3 [Varroa destructor]XP_022644007.1 neurofilament heavy polypeptide-like isoform X3 [Varroa destructor]
MFHMVTGYLPSVLPMAHRLSDQLAAAAPGEYVQLAISLANEKPLERPNISDALQECTRVLKVICPQETRIEKALKPTGTTPKESQKIMRKPEKLSKPPESSSKVFEASLPEKSTKVSEPLAVQLMDLTKMPEAPSKKAVLAIKPFKKLSETVETTTIKPESIKQAEDNIMDQPQNVISMYHESMKRSKGPIKQFEKPPKPLKSPSKESTKPLESPTKEVMKPSESLARKSQRPAIELQRFSKLLKSTTLKSETFSKLADNFTKSQGITKSMDSSRGKSQTSTKSIDSPTGKSQGHIKLTDSLTGKSQMAAPEPEHMKHSKGVSKRHETLGVHPISNAKQPGLFSKEPQSLVNVSENGKKLLVLTKKPESSKKQPKVLEKPCQRPKRRLQSTVQSMKSVITKPLKQVCSITSNGNSQNLMNIIEHFRKQSPNLTSRSERLKKKSRDRSRDSTKLSESSSEMSPKAMGPSDRLAKTGNRRKVKSHRKALSPQKQVQPAPRKSQNFAELTDRPSRFSKPARKLQSFKKIRRRSKQSERSIKKSPSPVKFGVARKLTARIGKPEAQNEKSPAAIKKTDIRVGKVQYLSKAVKNSVIKSQSFAKKSASLKLQDFTRASSPSAKSRDFIRRPGNLFIKSRNFARRAAHSAMKSRVSSRKPEITSIKPQNFAKSSEKKNMKSEGLTTFAETPSRSNNSKRLTEIPIGQSPSLSKLTTNRNGKCANLMTTPQNTTKCSENFVGFSVDAGKQSEYTLKEGKCSIPKQGEKFARQPERVSKEAEEVSKSEQD